ncbi:MAG: type II secretion system F family protein [bacterium]|nr:type II secretion system F family protein [bacterium]
MEQKREPLFKRLWRQYNIIFYRGKFPFLPYTWLPLSFVFAFLAALASYFIFRCIALAVLYFVLMWLFFAIGIPYYFMEKRLTEIEKALPYFLSQLSSALRSGMGLDSALNEVAKSLGGPLGEEVRRTLAEINKGITMGEAFRRAGERIGTKFVRRVFRILVSAVEQGGRLADVLDEIADNAQEIVTLRMEREAATTMPAMFIVAAGVLIAPIVFGITITLYKLMYNQSASVGFIKKGTGVVPSLFLKIILFYLAIEAFLSALLIAKMRWGKLGKGFVIAPVFAYVAPIVAIFAAKMMAGLLAAQGASAVMIL